MKDSSRPANASAQVIDSGIFHEWSSTLTLTPYMEPAWQELVTRKGDRGGPLRLGTNWLYRNPMHGNKAAESYPAHGIPGSDREMLAKRPGDRLVLGYDEGLLATGFAYHYLARTAVRAANDWTIDQWLTHDPRFYGLVLVSTGMPEEAAAEIRRVGTHERMVGIALGANGLGLPFGHPAYHPIYEAASELGLPIVIQVGSDAMTDMIVPPVAGGMPTTYAEYKVLGGQPSMTHAVSLITEGVFDRHPDLRVLMLGCGVAWLPGYLWRLDWWWKTNRLEAPWMQMPASEYFLRHMRITTYGFEWPQEPERLVRALNTLPNVENLLMYASGWPNSDFENPDEIAAKLPEAWRGKVMHENAEAFFRWPATAPSKSGANRKLSTSSESR
jgi:predicted TIM-barrel fold metal-dependent hydrolase